MKYSLGGKRKIVTVERIKKMTLRERVLLNFENIIAMLKAVR